MICPLCKEKSVSYYDSNCNINYISSFYGEIEEAICEFMISSCADVTCNDKLIINLRNGSFDIIINNKSPSISSYAPSISSYDGFKLYCCNKIHNFTIDYDKNLFNTDLGAYCKLCLNYFCTINLYLDLRKLSLYLAFISKDRLILSDDKIHAIINDYSTKTSLLYMIKDSVVTLPLLSDNFDNKDEIISRAKKLLIFS